MPIVEFQGQRFQFPDAATPEQIQGALQSVIKQKKDGFDSMPVTRQEVALNVDFDFIRELEGGAQTKGYVPEDKPGGNESGVTIASGFDLGQWDVQGARKAGVPDALLTKLKPYFGVKGTEAQGMLAERPLAITQDEAAAIDDALKTYHISEVAKRFNKSSNLVFEDIPEGWQTVIASMAFQYGLNLEKATPQFWQQVTTGKWDAALSNLRKFGDDFDKRRNREADYVEYGKQK